MIDSQDVATVPSGILSATALFKAGSSNKMGALVLTPKSFISAIDESSGIVEEMHAKFSP
jgi:hypothetical protein